MPRRVVVLAGPGGWIAEGVARALGEALAKTTDPLATRDTAPHPAFASEAAKASDAFATSDVVVALDGAELEVARDRGARFCVAVFPGMDATWGGDLGDVDCVVASHTAMVDELVRRGARRATVVVGGPIAPHGWRPAADRAAHRAGAGDIVGQRPVVVVAADALAEQDLGGLLVQLSLVSTAVTFLFDVGDDVEVANELRRLAPAHGIEGAIFAGGPESLPHWQLADLAVVRARGPEAVLGLAVGASTVVVAGARAGAAAAAWAATGAAHVADAMPSLAAMIDVALGAEALAACQNAARALDAAGGAERAAAQIADAWRRRLMPGAAVPRGLPVGLERLPAEGRGGARGSVGGGGGGDLEDKVERELAELRKRLGTEK